MPRVHLYHFRGNDIVSLPGRGGTRTSPRCVDDLEFRHLYLFCIQVGRLQFGWRQKLPKVFSQKADNQRLNLTGRHTMHQRYGRRDRPAN